eukprot:251762_1
MYKWLTGSRLKIILLLVIPYILAFGVYYHFGDAFSAQTVSWKDLIGNDEIVEVEENEQKQFGAVLVQRGNVSVSSDTLDLLLIEWGVDPKGMDENITQKINLLLKISSDDFWRRNYLIHPKHSRIKNFINDHQRYLMIIKSITKVTDRKKIHSRFVRFSDKINSHSQFEELILFKFFRDTLLERRDMFKHSIGYDGYMQRCTFGHILKQQHYAIHTIMANNILSNLENDGEQNNGDNVNECDGISDLLKKYELKLIEHFKKEERRIVHLMLNINTAQYWTYRAYLTLHWWNITPAGKLLRSIRSLII